MIRSDRHHKGSKNSICCIKPYQTFESKKTCLSKQIKKDCRQHIFESQIILIEYIINHNVPTVDCWKTPIGRSFCEAKVARGYQVKFKVETV